MEDPIPEVQYVLVTEAETESAQVDAAYPISKPTTTVGRHPANDITLPLESVSRYHARLEAREDALYVFDLGSSNGTFINQARVNQGVLRDQDQLGFGNVGFIVNRRDPVPKPPKSAFDSESSVRLVPVTEVSLQTVVQKMARAETTQSKVFEGEITDPMHLKRARELLSALYRFHKEIGGKTDESEIYETLLKLIFNVLPCERGVVLIRGEGDAVFRPVRTKYREGEANPRDIAISQTIVDQCLEERVALLSRDAMTDSRFGQAESIVLHDIRSAMCAPLISRDRVWGICFVDTSEAHQTFAETDLEFFSSLTGEVAILIDSARMMRQMQINEQMAMIGQTITGIAHNIKNILLLSQGGIELLDTCLEKKNYDALDKTWAVIKRGLDRINSMVVEMLEFSRRRKIEKTASNVNLVIQEAISFVAQELEKKSIALVLDLDDSIPDRMLDEPGFYKAFFNLLVNASEAVNEGEGKIAIRSRQEQDGSIRIWIQDNGDGIPEDTLSQIFMPFFTTKGSKGTGLGLPMTKKNIEAMPGSLRCTSEEGVGTVFEIVVFPEPEEDKTTAQPESQAPCDA